jgi:hypothetical protein
MHDFLPPLKIRLSTRELLIMVKSWSTQKSNGP